VLRSLDRADPRPQRSAGHEAAGDYLARRKVVLAWLRAARSGSSVVGDGAEQSDAIDESAMRGNYGRRFI